MHCSISLWYYIYYKEKKNFKNNQKKETFIQENKLNKSELYNNCKYQLYLKHKNWKYIFQTYEIKWKQKYLMKTSSIQQLEKKKKINK